MRPILYNATETVFDSYGLGEIDANKATVTRERNGNYSLYIEYPVGGSLTPLFKQDMRIKADAGVRTKNQTFYISRIVKDSSHVIKIYAKHISHLTEHMSINHGTNRSRATAMEALRVWASNLVGGVRFDVWSDIDTIGSIDWKLDKIKTAREALGGVEGSILDIWGGEYEFDNTTIKLHRRLGRQSPTVLEYGRNILSAEDDEDANNVYTSVYPFATYTPESQSHEEGKESKTQDPVTVTLPEKIVDSQWVGHYAERRVAVVDFSSKYGDKQTPSAESLRNFAREYMKTNRIGIPKINTKIEYADLAKTLDYADMSQMEEVELCDILPIYYPTIGLTNDENKVVVVNYDVLNDRNESIELGTIGQSMRSALTDSVSNRLDYLEAKQSALEETFPAYLVNAKGNKVWYRTPDNNVEHKVGDTWFEKNGQYDRIYIWNGEMWEKVIDTEDVDGIKKEFESKFQEIKKANAEIDKKAAEALKKSGANEVLANEAKTIADQSSTEMNRFKQESSKAQRDLSENVNRFKSELQQSLAGKADNATLEQTERALRQKFESLSTDALGKINAAKTEFEKTAQGLSTKITKVETYVNNDGQRQDDLKRYAREESASQARAVREDVTRDFVGKNTFQESVQGVERRLESISLGTSGNLLKNSNDGFYNQHDKRYRLVETLQANQTYTLVTKYWNGENATGHSFLDGIGNWRFLTYNPAIDAWMLQFTPSKEIPAGTEVVLSSDPYNSLGNMDWATLVRGAIPLIHWQPAKGDVEEGVTQKLAEYKETIDGRFATISSQLNGKANQSDFQRVKETSQLYERILGGSGSSDQTVRDNITRLVMTNQLFQTEVSKYGQGGPNLIKNSGNPSDSSNWGYWEIGQTPKLNVVSHSFFYNEKRKLFSLTNNTKIGVPASTIRFSLKRNTNYTVALTAFNTWNMKGATIFFLGRKSGENQSFTRVVTLVENVKFSSDEAVRKNYTFNSGECDEGFIRIDNNGTNDSDVAILLFGDVDVYEGTTIRPWQPSPEDTNEAVRTVQTQLAGSWAVKNLNNAGDVISQINATGSNILVQAEKILFKGHTLAEKLSAIDGYFKRLFVGEANVGTLNVSLINSNSITGDMLNMNKAFIQKLVSNDIFTNDLAAKRGFINQLKSYFISSTYLESYKGWIGGFQLGTHASGSGRWITGRNHFSVGMGDGEGGVNASALWVNWGYNWNEPGYQAWFVKNSGRMYCKNTAEFWSTPIVHGDLKVTGNIIYDGGTWVYSPIYNKLTKESSQGEDWLYLYAKGGGRDWVHMNKQISDRRYKSNIQDSQVSGLDVIEKLKTYSYRKKYDGKVEDISCGIMAQDVQKYAPEAFFENPDGAYSYRTFELVPYLIKAIQELNQKINLMEERYGSII